MNKEEIFNELILMETITYELYIPTRSHYNPPMYNKIEKTSKTSFQSIENTVNQNYSYNDRVNFIISRKSDKIDLLKQEIEKISRKIVLIESWDLVQIFENIDISPYLNGFENGKLIRNLLLNGYINENYLQYISLFHEVNVTRADYEFDRNVRGGIPLGYDYPLTEIKNLVKKIPDRYFQRKSILNFDLLSFLLINKSTYKDQLSFLLNLITSDQIGDEINDEFFRFIDGYIKKFEKHGNLVYDEKGCINVFINEICIRWEGFWGYLLDKTDKPKEQTDKFLRLIIKNVEEKHIIKLDLKKKLSIYIMEDEYILNLFPEKEQEKFATIIQKLEIKLPKLITPTKDTAKLFESIYKNSSYDLTINNIVVILNKKLESNSQESYNKISYNYDFILKSNLKFLKDYVNENINTYVKKVFLPTDNQNSEVDILHLLNNSNVEEVLKLKIIEEIKSKLVDLSKIKDTKLYFEILNQRKLYSSWNNIMTYYKSNELKLDFVLVDFLNSKEIYTELHESDFEYLITDNKDIVKSLSIDLIKSENLTFDSYSSLLKSIPNPYKVWTNIGFEKLDNNKVEYLIQNFHLSLSEENFNKLQDHFPSLVIKFLEAKESLLLDKFDDLNIQESNLIELLDSSYISQNNKERIIQKIDESAIINSNDISRASCKVIAGSTVAFLSFEVIHSIFKNSTSIKDRVKVLNLYFHEFEIDKIETLIKMLPGEFPRVLMKRKKPKLKNTEENLSFAQNLEKRKQISSYKIEKNELYIRIQAIN